MKRSNGVPIISSILGVGVLLVACVTAPTPAPIAATGVTPDPTLTAVCTPDESSIVCRDRIATELMTPGTPNTPNPIYLTQEADFATREAERPPNTPIPQPTDTPFASPLLTPAAEVGLMIFEGDSYYQGSRRFRVTYPTADWQLQGTELTHQTIANCMLLLVPGASGVPGLVSEEQTELAGKSWQTRFFSTAGLMSYNWAFETNTYSFHVRVLPDSSLESIAPCRSAAEAVLDTFEMVEP